jgi:hypothetical protein
VVLKELKKRLDTSKVDWRPGEFGMSNLLAAPGNHIRGHTIERGA